MAEPMMPTIIFSWTPYSYRARYVIPVISTNRKPHQNRMSILSHRNHQLELINGHYCRVMGMAISELTVFSLG